MLGCPIRISADQFVCANPRSFSQLITSFIASESLGIPHTLLFSLLYYLLFNEFYTISYYDQYNIVSIIIIKILLYFHVSFFNMSKNFFSKILNSGEYRSRTDDLLRARQALQPAELIPHIGIPNALFRITYLELTTSRISFYYNQQSQADSNCRPLHYQCSALTS